MILTGFLYKNVCNKLIALILFKAVFKNLLLGSRNFKSMHLEKYYFVKYHYFT